MNNKESIAYIDNYETNRIDNEGRLRCSVIMPVHNAARHLTESLDSLCAQTLKEIEILCIDDFSSDGSGEILEEYKRKDKRIRVIKNNTNVGAGESRNVGIKNARGEYLAILDADDVFNINMLEKMYSKATSENADVVVCDYVQYDESTGFKCFIRVPRWFRQKWCEDSGLSNKENRIYAFETIIHAPWNKLYRREFIIKENLCFSNVKAGNDIMFGDAVIIKADRIVYMGEECEPLLSYRVNHGNQITGKTNILFMDLYRALVELGEFIFNDKEAVVYRKAFINYFSYSIGLLFRRLDASNKMVFFEYFNRNWKKDFHASGWSKDDFYSSEDIFCFQNVFSQNCVEDIIYGLLTYRFQNEFWDKLRSLGSRAVLWGVGSFADSFVRKCDEKHYCLSGIVDKNRKDSKLGKYKISTPEEYDFSKIDVIVVYSSLFFDDIVNDIRKIKRKLKVVDVYTYYSKGLFYFV